ncbi:MAG: universal stress protein [Acidimicrobiales bacterium]
MYSTIVVGTDGSESAAEAVSAAAELARQSGAVLHLVTAYQASSGGMAVLAAGVVIPDPGPAHALISQRAHDILAEVAGKLEGVSIERHAAEGDPADSIVAVAEQVGADVIVVGSKGMNRRILGSVPNSVAHKAPCAVLIVKTV